MDGTGATDTKVEVIGGGATSGSTTPSPSRLASLLITVLAVLALDTLLLIILIFLQGRALRAANYQRF